ncbi:unnamed protein product [Rotaria magnacalcarata]|uniref:DNA-(apurinic or apyrimidinic site) endonuclease n=1 Tax=Rotaria magnacalcarata TaxID=392030 RepID=A0A815A3B7_9BILA|nr:unnamed protein product [Rotaria magnacalcarata]CAF1662420.1 unnamed protein product [Rotaria magnacalcarata]CAF1989848.1 unnamed protein product [Rotaria magnacalcarata]CAF2029254.1 unnamed protein product [Rotaria magnacalcarata]CAF2074103.1 unnamed protein product [Rotaria magnacalcarata]
MSKLKQTVLSKRNLTKNEDDKSKATLMIEKDKTDDKSQIKKGKKRTASTSPAKKVKKTGSIEQVDDDTENIEESKNESKQTGPMTLKTSDRLSCKNEKANLKLVSWNVNGIRAWITNKGLKYIEQEQPDIICFQELKCDKEKIPKEATPTGYKAFWLSGDQAGYSGVGLLTKIDPVDVKYGIGIAEHDNEGRVITAEYDKFYLVASYIPNSGRKLVRLTYRQKFNQAFHAYLKELDSKKPVIWCGDLNVSHLEIDLANPKTNTKTAGFTKEERNDFSKILTDGFIDSFRHLYPDKRDAYTYWAYFRNARQRNIGWRLDYFILSSNLQEYLCDFIIQNQVYGSDHCPIVLLLAV